jgi:hypothetical protein
LADDLSGQEHVIGWIPHGHHISQETSFARNYNFGDLHATFFDHQQRRFPSFD